MMAVQNRCRRFLLATIGQLLTRASMAAEC
jgi:hypothetical protein